MFPLKIRIRFQVMDMKSIAGDWKLFNINSQVKAWLRLRPQVSVLHIILLKVLLIPHMFLSFADFGLGWWFTCQFVPDADKLKTGRSGLILLLRSFFPVSTCVPLVSHVVCMFRKGCGVVSFKLSFYGAKQWTRDGNPEQRSLSLLQGDLRLICVVWWNSRLCYI